MAKPNKEAVKLGELSAKKRRKKLGARKFRESMRQLRAIGVKKLSTPPLVDERSSVATMDI